MLAAPLSQLCTGADLGDGKGGVRVKRGS